MLPTAPATLPAPDTAAPTAAFTFSCCPCLSLGPGPGLEADGLQHSQGGERQQRHNSIAHRSEHHGEQHSHLPLTPPSSIPNLPGPVYLTPSHTQAAARPQLLQEPGRMGGVRKCTQLLHVASSMAQCAACCQDSLLHSQVTNQPRHPPTTSASQPIRMPVCLPTPPYTTSSLSASLVTEPSLPCGPAGLQIFKRLLLAILLIPLAPTWCHHHPSHHHSLHPSHHHCQHHHHHPATACCCCCAGGGGTAATCCCCC